MEFVTAALLALGAFLGGLLLKNFLPSYVGEKGKNLANEGRHSRDYAWLSDRNRKERV